MRSLPLALIGLAALAALVGAGGARAVTGYTVDTTSDANVAACTVAAGDCSLRGALNNANTDGDTSVITFDAGVFPSGAPATITLGSTLPVMSAGGDTVDGSAAGVIVDGNAGAVSCFTINSSSNAIRGLRILNCATAIAISGAGATNNTIGGAGAGQGNVISGTGIFGITINSDASGNTISHNKIGTDAAGSVAAPNVLAVIIQSGATNNSIDGNLISGNFREAIVIAGAGTTLNTVTGNLIGTDVTGAVALANGSGSLDPAAVRLSLGATNNTIGGTGADRNVISGNARDGVLITGAGTNSNTIAGNYIGTDVNGTTALPNGTSPGDWAGVRIDDGAQNSVIGGAGEGNVISGNADDGLLITGIGTDSNSAVGNTIGADVNGTAALPNGTDIGSLNGGVVIAAGAQGNSVGGSGAGEGNLISGNSDVGVHITGAGTDLNTVVGNRIGTDVSGAAALANGAGPNGAGVQIDAGAESNTVGGSAGGEGNVISGNSTGSSGVGVILTGAGTGNNAVLGNMIGTDVSGTTALPNFAGMLVASGAQNNVIGGSTGGQGNVISGNSVRGVWMSNTGTSGNTITGNMIGTDVSASAAVPNGSGVSSHGGVVLLSGAENNQIGGISAGDGNVIAFNDGDGVYVETADTVTTGNTIRGNSIHSNTGKGIRNIVDTAPLAPPPVVLAAGSAFGNACPNCSVDVYSDAADEGRVFHGSTTANGVGDWAFSGAVVGPNVTATATDAAGNTSEFSAPLACNDSDADGVCNSGDNCPSIANANQADGDGDGVGTLCDNCPSTPNANQANGDGDPFGDACDNCPAVFTAWMVPPGDPDCDGFTDTEEAFVGTDPLDPCANTAAANDEADDRWPADLDDNQTVNILDVLQLTPPVFNTSPPDPNYSTRKDLNGDGAINILDILRQTPPVFNQSCT